MIFSHPNNSEEMQCLLAAAWFDVRQPRFGSGNANSRGCEHESEPLHFSQALQHLFSNATLFGVVVGGGLNTGRAWLGAGLERLMPKKQNRHSDCSRVYFLSLFLLEANPPSRGKWEPTSPSLTPPQSQM